MTLIVPGLTVVVALLVALSALGKFRKDPRQVAIIHEKVGIPLRRFPLLAAGELVGSAALLVGIGWPAIGAAGAAWLAIYFIGAILAHVRVGDVKGIGPAVTMLALALGVLFLVLETSLI